MSEPIYAPMVYSADPAVALAPPVRTNPEPDPMVAALAALRPEMDVRELRRLCGPRDGCAYYTNRDGTLYLRLVKLYDGTPDVLEDITDQKVQVQQLATHNSL